MIPESLNLDQELFNEQHESLPGRTYRLDFVNKRIVSQIDGKEAVMQFIHKALNTDKYAYAIYNWYYGNEIYTMVGMPYDYVVAECPRIMQEALLVDDRITDVTDFKFTKSSHDSLTTSCLVKTIYGDIEYSQEVMI